MGVWEKETGGQRKLLYLANGSGIYTKSIGMDLGHGDKELGIRSNCYSMILNNGVVESLNIDEIPSDAEESSATKTQGQL